MLNTEWTNLFRLAALWGWRWSWSWRNYFRFFRLLIDRRLFVPIPTTLPIFVERFRWLFCKEVKCA
jgi:hypothetical protein